MIKHVTHLALLALLVCVASVQASPGADDVQWMKVLLQGQQIGHVRISRNVVGDTVISTERMEINLARAGTELSIVTEETQRETKAGKALGFATLTEMGGTTQRSEGVINDNGQVHVSFQQAKDKRTQTLSYPAQALMSEGVRLLEQAKKLQKGDTLKFSMFVPSQLGAIDVSVQSLGTVDINIDGEISQAEHRRQTLGMPGMPLTLDSWTDSTGNLLRSETPMFGMTLVMERSTELDAGHRDDATDLLSATIVPAPRALSAEERGSDLALFLKFSDPQVAASLPTGEQNLSAHGDEWRLLVDVPPRRASKAGELESKPDAQSKDASAWVQSDASEIIRFARKASAGANSDRVRMQKLQSAVSLHISKKNLNVGYASALEALRMREGDCTEHALLLAASGRALNIPTRVVVGLAYVDQFAGHQQAFVPHAWVQAWVNQRWTSFDAALNGFDSGHIALGVGSGEPTMFYGSIGLLGNLSISRMEAADP